MIILAFGKKLIQASGKIIYFSAFSHHFHQTDDVS